jgi:hypothetical protein
VVRKASRDEFGIRDGWQRGCHAAAPAFEANNLLQLPNERLGDAKMNTKTIDGMRTLKAVLFATILSSCVGWATGAAAAKSFFCKATIASIGDPGPVSLSGPLVYDMGTVGSCTDGQYATNFNSACKPAAKYNCQVKATGIPPPPPDHNYNSAAFWCGLGAPNGSTIKAYAAIGPPVAPKGKYFPADIKGVLINKPAVTQTTYDCNQYPGTWLDNPSAGNGYHARCVKTFAVNVVPPLPPWTSIGTPWQTATGPAWVTDGSGNIWYGVPATATMTVVSPPECRWQ